MIPKKVEKVGDGVVGETNLPRPIALAGRLAAALEGFPFFPPVDFGYRMRW
jgi:hypothetical protein